jgi:hypothetical protein
MLTARDLEKVYATYTSASWRGDPHGQVLETWLRVHWVEGRSERPDTDPAAVSPHGAGGRGIFWYEGSAAIFGFVPGKAGCYLFKRSESIPAENMPRPNPVPPPRRLRAVAHFQSGTYARHLLVNQSPTARSRN